MIRTLTCLVLAAAALCVWSGQASAAQSYDNCTGFITSLPATISTQGTWCLDKDLSTALTSGNAITINTNNVTLDCNHFKIGGLAAGPGTSTYGVRAAARFNATVRNCNIRGFYIGINFSGSGGGHLVEDSSFDGNTVYGVWVAGAPGSTVRNNIVVDTGGSTVSTGAAFGIVADDGVDVLNNTINGVAPTGTNAWAYGIDTFKNGAGSISGNRVRGLAPTGSGEVRGIYNSDSGRIMIRDNDVQGTGADGIGVYCNSNQATARGNMIAGFTTGISNCMTDSNSVNTN